jgi:DNA-binding beta-propeller fold protein YncE
MSVWGADSSTNAIHATAGRLFFLDVRGGRVISVNPDGSDEKVLLTGLRTIPDGIVVDPSTRHVFWTTMGKAKLNDGSVQRLDIDGSNLTTIVPEGGTFTAKQLKLDRKHSKLYWSDREGMKIMRANVDGSKLETLIVTGQGEEAMKDAKNWCVGIAVDLDRGKIYWTQKGGDNANEGRLLRANLEIPKGQDPEHRKDIEVLFDGLPEPIDLDLDLSKHMVYWTDRGDPPRGNTVSRAPMDPPKHFDPKNRTDQEILVRGLKEGIGIALDLKGGRMFVTDLGGNVYSANLDGSDEKTILTGQGSLTGIAYVELQK